MIKGFYFLDIVKRRFTPRLSRQNTTAASRVPHNINNNSIICQKYEN